MTETETTCLLCGRAYVGMSKPRRAFWPDGRLAGTVHTTCAVSHGNHRWYVYNKPVTTAKLRAVLTALTADEWAGWGFDEGRGAFACFYCHAYTEYEEHGRQHKPDCPLVKARQLLGTQPQETTEEA